MATVKKTVSIGAETWDFVTAAARRAGLSSSAWLSRIARQQAIHDAYMGTRAVGDDEAVAMADEAEAAAGEDEGQQWRAAG